MSLMRCHSCSGNSGGFLLVEYSHLGESVTVSNDPFLDAPSYDLLNLRLGLQFERYDASLTLWGRNVLDEEYRYGGWTPIANDGKAVAGPREPATYGLTLRKLF